MERPLPERVGVVVVRAWMEPHDGQGLRARITRSTDLLGGRETTLVVASADEVVDEVRRWLDELLRN